MSGTRITPRAQSPRRDGKSLLVSLLLLGGIIVGGAGFLSQHYRIELVPRQGAGAARAPGSPVDPADRSRLADPEIILVDGCEAELDPLLANKPLLPAPRPKSASKAAPRQAQPCDDELPMSPLLAGGPRAEQPVDVMPALEELLPGTAVGEPSIDPGAVPAVVQGPGGDLLPVTWPVMVGVGGLGPRSGGITSLPAIETGGPKPDDDDDGDDEDDENEEPEVVQVPEPGSLGLLGLGVLAALAARRNGCLRQRV